MEEKQPKFLWGLDINEIEKEQTREECIANRIGRKTDVVRGTVIIGDDYE